MYDAFADLYDSLMDDVPYDEWADRLDLLLKERGTESVVDCACGTGNLTLRLHEKGYNVLGTDISEDMLRVHMEKQIENGVSYPLVQMDMRELSLPYLVDAITCCCDGVNYLLEEEELLSFLRGAKASLAPKGMLLFDISSEYKLRNTLGRNTYGEDRPECTYLWQNIMDEKDPFLEMDLTFFLPNSDGTYDRMDETQVQRIWKREEIETALLKTGFTDIRVTEAVTGAEPVDTTERLQFTAVKGD